MEGNEYSIARARPVSAGYELRLVVILCLAGGVAALDAQAIFYLMPFIAEEFALTDGQIGFLGSAVLIGWSLSGLAIGLISDRIGKRKPFLIGAFLGLALLSSLSALAAGFLTLFLARVLIGMAEGPIIPIKQTMVIAESRPSRRGLNMGIVQNFGAQLLGSLLGPLIIVAIATQLGWRLAFLLAGVPAIIIAFLIWQFLREPAAQAGTTPAFNSTADPVRMQNSDQDGGLARLWRLIRIPNVLLCIAIATPGVAWYFILLTFVPVILVRELGFTPVQMSQAVAMIGAAGVVSAALVPGLSDKLGRKWLVVIFCLIGTFAPLGVYFAGASSLLVGGSLFLGCFMVGTFPLVMATIPQESVLPADRATATSLVLCVSQLGGGVLGPLVAGELAEQVSAFAPILLAVGLALAAAFFATLLTRPGEAT